MLGASDDPNHLGWFDVASWTRPRRRRTAAPPPGCVSSARRRRSRRGDRHHHTLHEALLQDVRAADGRVSAQRLVLAARDHRLAPAKAPARSYAVTLQATHVVCDDYGEKYWKEILNFDALVKYGTISADDLKLFPGMRTIHRPLSSC